MSLHPTVSGEVPTPTAAVARAAFPRGNPYLLLRDQLGTIFTDAQFAPLFAPCGQPAECPWRLALDPRHSDYDLLASGSRGAGLG